jgi:hypothetical protein
MRDKNLTDAEIMQKNPRRCGCGTRIPRLRKQKNGVFYMQPIEDWLAREFCSAKCQKGNVNEASRVLALQLLKAFLSAPTQHFTGAELEESRAWGLYK